MTTKMMTMTTRMSPLLRNDLRNQHANDLCFFDTGSPSRRLTFCQLECGTGNKLPLARDVKLQTLRLFIPLYIDLYFLAICLSCTHWFCILRRIDQLCSNGASPP